MSAVVRFREKTIHFLGLSFLLNLLPGVFAVLFDGRPNDSLESFLGQGQLLLAAVVICAYHQLELFPFGFRSGSLRWVVAGLTLLVALVSALAFGQALIGSPSWPELRTRSMWLLAFAVSTSYVSTLIAEFSRPREDPRR